MYYHKKELGIFFGIVISYSLIDFVMCFSIGIIVAKYSSYY